ncbi:undecaprenyl-diphosphatase [Diaminobutyricimonas aerilata]|uniref:Undecaprenyl-diphosphatase n=1 Tax=Diaminobutyricimonas aerilata TaxID=1162967 RepID=A0A2M9CKL6_9MICO|nr:bifunctional phosphatase PAP2/diacylglycerol kinase family protein [Diaminobutyricimonas aerilata]PJJ72424.1 undecaprenyl-diphosphatase [Diaminobutyricimonas aerilata]
MPRPPLNPIIALRRLRVLPRWVRRVDGAVARRINRRRTPGAVDTGYRRLSEAANHGRLWFALAGALVVLGRPRAAVRGVASLTLASIIANLIGKRLFGGDRPILKDVPLGRRLRQQPTSASFPSGHSASAAAFATGVAVEWPKAGAVVAPLALGVIYSRLHVGAHWFSDVVGGSALGVGVAAAGKALVPAPRRPAKPEGGLPVTLPASPDGAEVAIVVNPSSGTSVRRPDPVPVLERRLPRARIVTVGEGQSLEQVARDLFAAEPRPTVLGVCGGDGSIDVGAHVAREMGVPLLALPGGTFNHFVRSAGVETIDAGIDALQAGHGLRVDVAELRIDDEADVTVLNAASVGIYPDFVALRERYQGTWGKWIASLIAAVAALRTAEPVEIVIGGRRARAWSVFVGVNRNHPAPVTPLQRARLDDGVLDVRILHAGARIRAVASLVFARRAATVLRGIGVAPGPSAVDAFETDELVIEVRPREGQPPGLAHDGEVELEAAETPRGRRRGYVSRIRLVPLGLEVYSPRY